MAKLIALHGKYGEGKFAVVDDEDFDEVNQHKWFLVASGNGKFYVRVRGTYLHRLVTKAKSGEYIDHIDGNTLDNKKYNLRSCTNQQNVRNCKSNRGKSRYKGVCPVSKSKSWRATLSVNMKSVHIGSFATEIEAAKAYDEAARKHYGEFARTNF